MTGPEKLRMMVRSRERSVRKYLRAGEITEAQAERIRAKSREMLELASRCESADLESTFGGGSTPNILPPGPDNDPD